MTTVRAEDREGGVRLLTLDRPPANAINGDLLTDLSAALEAAAADDSVRAVVITGAGRFFSGPPPPPLRLPPRGLRPHQGRARRGGRRPHRGGDAGGSRPHRRRLDDRGERRRPRRAAAQARGPLTGRFPTPMKT